MATVPIWVHNWIPNAPHTPTGADATFPPRPSPYYYYSQKIS